MRKKVIRATIRPDGKGDVFTLANEIGPICTLVLKYAVLQSQEGVWFSNKTNRREIAKELGVSDITVRKHVSTLAKGEYLVRMPEAIRGAYEINELKLGISLV